MKKAGFAPQGMPGQWVSLSDIQVDLLVPETLVSNEGSRGARMPPHHKHATRKVLGIEGCIVDNDPMLIVSLDPTETRSIEARVAGPGGLMVAKLVKMWERIGTKRVEPKDALDTFRLLRAIETAELKERLEVVLNSKNSGEVGAQALKQLESLFGAEDSAGTESVAESLQLFEDPSTVKASCAALAMDLIKALDPPIAAM
ncbi:MAG: hypothetical protein ABR507_09425 [Actinomycetota bacterium]